jgi:hypothetical protein
MKGFTHIFIKHFHWKGESITWISAFLVEKNYQLWKEIELNAGNAEILQWKHIRMRNKKFKMSLIN